MVPVGCVEMMVTAGLNGLNIPDEAVKYILFQRTGYLRSPVTLAYRHLFRRLPFETPLYNLAVAIEARFAGERVKALYRQDMGAEFATLQEALPDSCAAILDIGCGVAGIDVWLERHYGEQRPEFYLLDRTETSGRVYYLLRQRAAFYNSLDVARALLMSNGIPASRMHLIPATDQFDIPVDGQQFELILSLLSWGFHFPVETYAPRVAELLADGGRVVLDVRHGTGGLRELRRWFAHIHGIHETEKYTRVVAML